MDECGRNGVRAERRGGACCAFFSAATIRANLLWLVAVCMLPGLLGAAFLLEYVYQRERGELEQNLLQTAAPSGRPSTGSGNRQDSHGTTFRWAVFRQGDLALAHQRANDLSSMHVSSTMVLSNRPGNRFSIRASCSARRCPLTVTRSNCGASLNRTAGRFRYLPVR
jgi:hypothetical protein